MDVDGKKRRRPKRKAKAMALDGPEEAAAAATTTSGEPLQVIDVSLPEQKLKARQARALIKMATDPTSLLNRLNGAPPKQLARGPPSSSTLGPRTMSTTVAPSKGISIKGSAGPTAVLISNLEHGTQSEDLRIALSTLNAKILSCHVKPPRPNKAHTAEPDKDVGLTAYVVFSTALEARACVDKFNGVSADHRILKVTIKGPAKPPQQQQQRRPNAVPYPSKTASVSTGRMYSDRV